MAKFETTVRKTEKGKTEDVVKTIEIEIGTKGSGYADRISDVEKDLRRFLMLPITKDLVYYPSAVVDIYVNVVEYEVVEIFNKTEPWFTLKLTLEDFDKSVLIHHRYFSEMQSPSFVSYMSKLDV